MSIRSVEIFSVHYSHFTQAAVCRNPLPSRPISVAGSAWALGAPGRSVAEAHPPDALDRPAQAPRPGRGWGRACWQRWAAQTAESRGFGGCLGTLGRTQVSRQEPASLARVFSTPVQDEELFIVSRLHDP